MQNLLPKLVEILINASKNDYQKIMTRDAIGFLLGISTDKEDSEYSRLKSNPMELSIETKSELLNKRWDLSELNYDSNILKEVEQRFSEYYKNEINHDDGADISTKIKQMVFYSVFGTIYPAVFRTRNIKNSYKNNSNYIDRPKVIQSIQRHFAKNNILILTGEPAIGKTQVILEYIQKSDYKEVAWLKGDSLFEESLEKQINNGVEISLPSEVTIETALSEKSDEALIVIERAVLQKEDYDYIMNRFHEKKLHIIMATRKAPSEALGMIIHLDRMSSGCLFQIFKNHLSNNRDFFTKEEFDSLLQIIDSNTLVVALLGKTLNKFFSKSHSPEEAADIKERLLDSKKWIWKDKSLPNINQKNYMHNPSTNKVIYFIRAIISQLRISDDDKLRYAELALWIRGTMAVKDLNNWCTDGISKTIDDAVGLGIAEYIDDDKTILRMHPFISDILWSEFIHNPRGWEDRDKRKRQLKPIVLLFEKNISKFLEQLKPGRLWESSYTMLYNTADTLIYRIRMEMYSEEEQRFDKEDWWKLWEIMEQIRGASIKYGNATMAKNINQELYHYDCPKNTDNPDGRKQDTISETKSAGLYLFEIFVEWMNGQDPEPLIAQIPKRVSGISYKDWAEGFIPLLQKLLEKVEDGIIYKVFYDNMSGQDKAISKVLTSFKSCLSWLQMEYMHAGNPNHLRVGYYCSIFHYLRALCEYSSAQTFFEEVSNARWYYGQVHSQISDSDGDFRFIVIFSHIFYECCIFKDSLMFYPSIQDIQYWWNDIYNLFESTEKEYNKYLHSEECSSSHDRAYLFIETLKSAEKGNIKELVEEVENIRSSFKDQIHIDKREQDKKTAVFDNAITGLNNINE